MNKSPEAILKKLLTGRSKYSVAEVRRFIAYFAKFRDSKFEAECERLFQQNPKPKETLSPPAGLKAKQAVPIVLAYVRDELGKSVSLEREERGSFSAMVEALDRRFGEGFTARVVSELNALPNGSVTLHYKR